MSDRLSYMSLRRSFLYEDVIEDDTEQEAMNIARKESARREIDRVPEGRLRLIDAEKT